MLGIRRLFEPGRYFGNLRYLQKGPHRMVVTQALCFGCWAEMQMPLICSQAILLQIYYWKTANTWQVLIVCGKFIRSRCLFFLSQIFLMKFMLISMEKLWHVTVPHTGTCCIYKQGQRWGMSLQAPQPHATLCHKLGSNPHPQSWESRLNTKICH